MIGSKFVAKRQLNEVNTFIQWAELTEMEVKNFIKLVDKQNKILIGRAKRNFKPSLKSNSTEPKRSRHC